MRLPTATAAPFALLAALFAALTVAGLAGAPAAAQVPGLSFGGDGGGAAPSDQTLAPPEAADLLDLDYEGEHGAWTIQCVAGTPPDVDRCVIATEDGQGPVRLGFVLLEDPDAGLISQFRLAIAEGTIDPAGPILLAVDDAEPIRLTEGYRVVAAPLAVIGDPERLAAIGQAMSAPDARSLAITVPRLEGAPAAADLPLDGFNDAVGALFTHLRETMPAPADGESGSESGDGASQTDPDAAPMSTGEALDPAAPAPDLSVDGADDWSDPAAADDSAN